MSCPKGWDVYTPLLKQGRENVPNKGKVQVMYVYRGRQNRCSVVNGGPLVGSLKHTYARDDVFALVLEVRMFAFKPMGDRLFMDVCVMEDGVRRGDQVVELVLPCLLHETHGRDVEALCVVGALKSEECLTFRVDDIVDVMVSDPELVPRVLKSKGGALLRNKGNRIVHHPAGGFEIIAISRGAEPVSLATKFTSLVPVAPALCPVSA